MPEADLRGYLAGAIPANIALMRLVMAASSPDEIELALAGQVSTPAEAERREALAALWREHPEFWSLAKTLQATVDHSGGASGTAEVAAAFDRAAALSSEASVALYSLGDAALLERATGEIVEFLAGASLISERTRVLDIGCGTGRFEAALAPRLRNLVGVEVSAVMAQAARRRCAGFDNVEIATCDGRAPPDLPAASFDLAMAIDCFPYIVQAGVATNWFEALGRLLGDAGQLLIANYSYRDDLARDAAEIAALGRRFGLEAVTLGERPFRLWDGAIFQLRKVGTRPALDR